MVDRELVVGSLLASTGIAVADIRLVDLWLHGRSSHTQRAYRSDIAQFTGHAGKPLASITLADVQGFADSLQHLAVSTRGRKLSAVKSLLSFGHRIGLLPVNAAAPLRLPAIKNALAERILSETDVLRMLSLEPHVRNRALLRLLYASGARVSEISRLTWSDVQERGEAGQVTFFGKGGKTRAVLLTPATWRELQSLRQASPSAANGPVFRSRLGTQLSQAQIWRIVRAAAHRAGLEAPVSPHWLRHAHASHALDHGAPIHLVQATLGHTSVATTGKYLHARPTDSSARYLAV